MSFENFQQQAHQLRTDAEARRVALQRDKQRLAALRRQQQQLRRSLRPGDRETTGRMEQLAASERTLREQIDRDRIGYAAAFRDEIEQLNERLAFANPVDNLDRLNDDTPILMFPLRLETRFKQIERDGQPVDQLWVRVFPDDIVIDTFESDLSDTEVRNIRSYWVNRWKAGREEGGNRAAWRNLAAAHGPGRAYWLTRNYVPDNPAEEPVASDDEIILVIAASAKPVDPELAALDTYWRAVWKGGQDTAALTGARENLVAAVGGEVAAQALLEANTPANLDDPPPAGHTRESTRVTPVFVVLPDPDAVDSKLHAWSRPPSSTILPERFVLLAYHAGELDMDPQLGALVSPELILGPDPAAPEGEELRLADADDVAADPDITEGDLIFAERLRWMFDFDTAVRQGMGFKIELSAEQARRGFDRVLVLGVKLAADKQAAQTQLEALFTHHQASRKGMSLLRQGTPTNNTEEEGAGYSWRHNPDDSFERYFGDAPAAVESTGWFDKCDGRWLADMLGVDPGVLQALDNYRSKDVSEAMAMQRVLWPATLGHFMQSTMNPVFSDAVIDRTRTFFSRYVNGRGCVPAIRVGKQPYGILPTSNITGMRWFQPREPGHETSTGAAPGLLPDGDRFLTALYAILMDMDQVWAGVVPETAHLGKSGDPQQTLLDVVGLHPNSVDLYKRYANTVKQVWNIYLAGGSRYSRLARFLPTAHSEQAALLARYGYRISPKTPAPKLFDKVFFENAWILKGPRVDTVPSSETDPVRSYTDDERNYIQWLIDAARDSHDRLRSQDGFSSDKPPATLLYLLMYHALDLSYVDTSLKLHLNAGLLNDFEYRAAFVDPDFIHIEEGRETESRWKHVYKKEPLITGGADILLERFIPQNLGTLGEAAVFRDVLAGMEALVDVPTARLERLMLEHIDTVSYRYDAWISAYLHHQLELMRGLHENSTGGPVARQGIYLGAYGWLEDLRPKHRQLRPVQLDQPLAGIFDPDEDLQEDLGNGGYILAPSQNHAVTAAVLRNGHLSSESALDSEQLKIKLTSERVRLALRIVEGIQGGQTLAALLGYQFERGLHDRTDAEVDEFILDLRNEFPLVAGNIKDTSPAADDEDYDSITQIEANNVIDGLAFLEHIDKTGHAGYPFGLELAPADSNQARAIDDEVRRLIDINDALADLAMAESVHQVVLGNYERAAAVLDTYSKGHFPPTPDVIRTPRSGITLTHRVGLQFKAGLVHDLADPGVTPRMHAEPAMNAWLSDVLPAVNSIVCVVKYQDRTTGNMSGAQVTMADLGLSALDLLYLLDVDNEQAMSTLDDLLIHHVMYQPGFNPYLREPIRIEYTGKINAHDLTVFEVASLLASLRALLLKSRYLNAGDVRPPGEADRRQLQTLTLAPGRLQPVIDGVVELRDRDLQSVIDDLAALVAADDLASLVDQLDRLVRASSDVFIQASRYGMAQTGIGFVYGWQQSMLSQLMNKVGDLEARWKQKRVAYLELRDTYIAMLGSGTAEEKFALLRRLELTIATRSTQPLPATPELYFSDINDNQFTNFETLLDNAIADLSGEHRVGDLLNGIRALAARTGPFDLIGISIEEELRQVRQFADDLLIGARNLGVEMTTRVDKAQALLDAAVAGTDASRDVELVCKAGKAVFGEQFVMVPEFAVDDEQAGEWRNALGDANSLLRYLENDLDIDFPVDDWLYGVSRVRGKLYQLENCLLQSEGLAGNTLQLIPVQFPYREQDYWLGLQYPEVKESGDEPFLVDEEKLLYTAVYAEAANPAQRQCGLLIDEWTEVIPSREETAGLSFHYDQPNSEPPQALLLVTPSEFTGNWRWSDLVDALHATLDMAKKRAVEPDQVDAGVYSLFLPSIVSPASPMPLTATLNLALNNQVFFSMVNNDE